MEYKVNYVERGSWKHEQKPNDEEIISLTIIIYKFMYLNLRVYNPLYTLRSQHINDIGTEFTISSEKRRTATPLPRVS